MQTGKFVHLITIEEPIETQEAGGAGDVTAASWQAVAGFTRIPAEVLPDRAQEFVAAKQIQATRNALVRLYYREGITEKMRVVHHLRPGLDDYYDIAGVVHFQARGLELRLMCVQRTAEGYRRGTDLSN